VTEYLLRQLTRQQFLQKYAGQQRVTVYTCLSRMYTSRSDMRIEREHEGIMELDLNWAVSKSRGRRASPSPLRPQELERIVVVTHGWAEASPDSDMGDDGDIMVEDYLMQCFAPDGEGEPLGTPPQE
jgi:hypothetical protein